MNMMLFSVLFVVLGIIYYLVGMAAGQKVESDNDYFLAGRSLGFWSLTGTLLATQLGGGMILGTAAHAYNIGIYGIFYSVGMAAGFLVLGLGIAGALRSFNISTTAELFEQQFGSVRLKQVASFLSILSLAGLFIGQVVSSKFLMLGLGVTNEWFFLLFWISLVGYTMYGGLPAVIATDLLQVVLIIIVFVGLFLGFSWQGVVNVASLKVSFLGNQQGAFFQEYWLAYIGMPLLFSLVEQDLAQRFFAARSKAVAMISSLVASLLTLLFAAIPVCIGIQARLSGIAVADGQNPLIAFIGLHGSELVYVLVMCALIAAIASTADSLLCAVSSNLVQDFIPAEKKQMRLWAAKVATGVVGAIGVISSYYLNDILSVLTQSYQLLVSSILVAVLVCLTAMPRSTTAAALSVGAGFGSYLIFCLVPAPWGIPQPIAALLLSACAYGVGILCGDTNVTKRS